MCVCEQRMLWRLCPDSPVQSLLTRTQYIGSELLDNAIAFKCPETSSAGLYDVVNGHAGLSYTVPIES